MIQWRYLRCRGLTVCALKKDRKAILEKLQSMGVLQVDPVSGDDRGLQENGYSRAEYIYLKRRQLLQIRRWIFWINMYRKRNLSFLLLRAEK